MLGALFLGVPGVAASKGTRRSLDLRASFAHGLPAPDEPRRAPPRRLLPMLLPTDI